jgi:UDP-N-acetyl-D-glucosamine dehydrogenase
MAHKPNIHDTRESPSLEVMRQLLLRGGEVRYCDPWVPEFELDGVLHRSVDWSAEEARESDCIVMLTAHRQFLDEPHWQGARLIVDTRNAIPPGPSVRAI